MRLKRAAKGLALTLLLLAASVACQSVRNGGGPDLHPPDASAIRVGTLNVHYIDMRADGGRWSQEDWERRKGPLSRAVGALRADVIAFQEMETFFGGNDDSQNLARSHLLSQHPEFAAAAIGDWRAFPSTQPIFYRRSRMNLRDQGWFFFSDTPDVIYSRTFNGSYPAFASWALFEDIESGTPFRVINIHTDYASSENRQKSVALVADRMRPWVEAGEAVFLVGDLNARLGSDLHRRLEAIGLTFVRVEGATYHFDRGLNLFGAIDHIAFRGARPVGAPVVVRERFGDAWPSDHYPVIADFRLN